MTDRSFPTPYEENKPPAIREEMPSPVERPGSEYPALAPGAVDLSHFFDFLHSMDLELGEFLDTLEVSLSSEGIEPFLGLSEKRPLSKSPEIERWVSSYGFSSFLEAQRDANSGLFAALLVVTEGMRRGIVDIEQFDLLLKKTRSWASGLGIGPEKTPLLDQMLGRGLQILTILRETPSFEILRVETGHFGDHHALSFVLRQMNLMALIEYPHILEAILPEGVDRLLREEHLRDLSRAREGVSTTALMALLRAFKVGCLILVKEGEGAIHTLEPVTSQGEKVVDRVALFRSGGHFYLLVE